MKVLHILDHSLPHFSSYSLRSDYLIRTQKRLGLEPVVVTSPAHGDFTDGCEKIGEIDCYRVRWPALPPSAKIQALPMIKQIACAGVLSKEIRRLAGELKIDIIHSHSPALNGLAAARASEQAGLPWVHELRCFDEDAAVDRGLIRHNSLRYRTSQRLGRSVLEEAPCVVAISAALCGGLVELGIAGENVFEVPQGVDTDLFRPHEPDPELVARYNLAGRTVIGSIGSPSSSSGGIESLIDAVLLLLAERPGLVLLLAGEAGDVEGVRERIPECWHNHFIFAGKVPYHEMHRYYSVMDLLVCPRRRSRLTELSPPLNPLEAMAMGRPVVGSSLGVIRELLNDGERGILVEPGDSGAMAASLARLVDDRALRHSMGGRAREFVERERAWGKIVERYLPIYGKAMRSARMREPGQ